MNIKELKEGEIYKCDNETILKWGKNDSTENIDLIDCKFNTTKGHYINGEFTKANDREIHWFNKCSELGKYITYEKAMETYKEEFIVGKWYKVPSIYDNFYIKYKETKETIGNTNRKGKYYTEVIDKGEYTKKYDWICNGHKIEPLKNLSEIQQYLPKDHPDKTPVIDNKSRAKLKLIKKANTLTTTLYKKADDFSLISKNLLTRDNNLLHLIKTRTSFVLTAPKRTKLTIIKTKQLNF